MNNEKTKETKIYEYDFFTIKEHTFINNNNNIYNKYEVIIKQNDFFNENEFFNIDENEELYCFGVKKFFGLYEQSYEYKNNKLKIYYFGVNKFLIEGMIKNQFLSIFKTDLINKRCELIKLKNELITGLNKNTTTKKKNKL